MTERRFAKGEVVFREGDPSEIVFRVVSGAVEIVKELRGQEVTLGRVGAGEYFGEMGVIEGRPRSATVKALETLIVEPIARDAFLRRISEDRDTAFELMLRLSERLHSLDDAFTASVVTDREPQAGETGPGTVKAAPQDGRIVIHADSDTMAGILPAGGLVPEVLPFFVGREPAPGESEPPITIDLPLRDSEPYRLAKVHFSVAKTKNGYAVRDFRTELGTKVNETALGEHFSRDVTLLADGENTVVAGGDDSPFRFRIVVPPG